MFNKMGMHTCLAGMSRETDLRNNTDTTTTVNKNNKPLHLAPGTTGNCHCEQKNDSHCVPLRTGGATVWKFGSNILNGFFKPQWTVAPHVDDLPMFPLFFGLNATFGK